MIHPDIPHSYHLFSSGATAQLDAKTISEFGIDGFTLMEIAATRASDFIHANEKHPRKTLVLCGKGNNAGDALAVARHLSEKRYPVTVAMLLGSGDLSPDARKNFLLLKKLQKQNGDYIRIADDLTESPDVSFFDDYEILIDGIFGTGLNSKIRGNINSWIQKANQPKSLRTYSLDIPSGLSGDSGDVYGTAIKADFTLMFGTRKTGCFSGQSREFCGSVHLLELPFPNYLKPLTKTYLIDDSWFKEFESAVRASGNRPEHKYKAGVVYIIGGSPGMTGAPVMAAKAAWSTGCGAVTLPVPAGLLPAFDAHLTEQVRIPVGKPEDNHYKPEHAQEILNRIANRPGTVLIGPGIGRHPDTREFLSVFLQKLSSPTVIDADALWICGEDNIPIPKNSIITPHPGELQKLMGDVPSLHDELIESVRDFSKTKNCITLAKGWPVILSDGSETYLSSYDNSPFNRTGFGDVLAGKISGYESQFNNYIYSCLKAIQSGQNYLQKNAIDQPVSPLDLL